MMERVVVTGLGMVTPLGHDVESTWQGLMEGRSAVGPITRFDVALYKQNTSTMTIMKPSTVKFTKPITTTTPITSGFFA